MRKCGFHFYFGERTMQIVASAVKLFLAVFNEILTY